MKFFRSRLLLRYTPLRATQGFDRDRSPLVDLAFRVAGGRGLPFHNRTEISRPRAALQLVKLDDRFHETHPIGCHHSSLVSLACRSYILVIRSWSAYDSNHGNARLGQELLEHLPPRRTGALLHLLQHFFAGARLLEVLGMARLRRGESSRA